MLDIKEILDNIVWIAMIWFGTKLVITPAAQLAQQFPKMPSATAAKIAGGIVLVVGIGILVLKILMWMGKV